LRLQDHETYSIAKGKTNATIRNGFRKTRPMS
jgi:hypothetical protein